MAGSRPCCDGSSRTIELTTIWIAFPAEIGTIILPLPFSYLFHASVRPRKTAMIPRTSNIVFANAAAVFLASKDSSFITGIELSVDGGFTPVLAKHTKSFN